MDKSFKHFARVWGAPGRVSAALGTAECSEWRTCWQVACRLLEGTDLGECFESSIACEFIISIFVLSGEGDGREAGLCREIPKGNCWDFEKTTSAAFTI